MNVREFIEKYGENIPEGATICDPEHKPEVFFVAPPQSFIEDALAETGANTMYRDRTLAKTMINGGETVYFPKKTSLELNEDRAYLPLWEIYETHNLGPDGMPLKVRFYRTEEVFPENYAGDAGTISFKKIYLEEE